MASGDIYASFFDQAAGGTVNYASSTVKMALLTSAYTPNLSTHVHFSDLTNEVTGTGYTAGGTTLGSKTHVVTAANSWGVSWAATTAFALGDVVRPATGNGFLYTATVAGTTASSAPTWPTTVGATVTDGSVTWTNIGQAIVVWSSAAAVWSSSTITARYGVIYETTNNVLMAVLNFGSDLTSSAGTLTLTPPTTGWFFVTVA